MKKQFAGFDWDSGNYKKCQKHGLLLIEIEEFFKGEFQIIKDSIHSSTEERYIAVGYSTRGRPVLIGFTYRKKQGRLFLRPISARYMHEKERLKYEKAAT